MLFRDRCDRNRGEDCRPCELGLGECIRQSAGRKQSRKVRVSISMVYVTIAVLIMVCIVALRTVPGC